MSFDEAVALHLRSIHHMQHLKVAQSQFALEPVPCIQLVWQQAIGSIALLR